MVTDATLANEREEPWGNALNACPLDAWFKKAFRAFLWKSKGNQTTFPTEVMAAHPVAGISSFLVSAFSFLYAGITSQLNYLLSNHSFGETQTKAMTKGGVICLGEADSSLYGQFHPNLFHYHRHIYHPLTHTHVCTHLYTGVHMQIHHRETQTNAHRDTQRDTRMETDTQRQIRMYRHTHIEPVYCQSHCLWSGFAVTT